MHATVIAVAGILGLSLILPMVIYASGRLRIEQQRTLQKLLDNGGSIDSLVAVHDFGHGAQRDLRRTLLTCLDHDEIPHADVFVDAVMVRVNRQHRYRRIMLAVIGSLVALGACVAMMRLPVSLASGPAENPFQIGILLALASLCGWAWGATEETRLPISLGKGG